MDSKKNTSALSDIFLFYLLIECNSKVYNSLQNSVLIGN